MKLQVNDMREVPGEELRAVAETRNPTLDTIRGLSVLGILIVNIQSFGLAGSYRLAPLAPGDSNPVNLSLWYLTHILADGRFMTVFSLLFGAGICLMSDRIERKGHHAAPVHFRRMLFLAFIGLLHSYLLWSGDILFTYAICGSACWFFRRLNPFRLFVIGSCFFALGGTAAVAVWSPAAHNYLAMIYQVIREVLNIPSVVSPSRELLVYKGSWARQMALRVPLSLDSEVASLLILNFWRICGTFLLGMGLLKTGFLTGSLPSSTYKWSLRISGVAVVISIGAVYLTSLYGVPMGHAAVLEFVANMWLSIPIGIGWVSIAILLARSYRFRILVAGLKAMGRTAFTNYILQTLVCTTLFYGHGFGLFGSLDRLELMGVMALIWVAEILASILWLKHFSYGPIEWLQRFFVYCRRPSARVAQTTSTLA